jgi:hypothetical protein
MDKSRLLTQDETNMILNLDSDDICISLLVDFFAKPAPDKEPRFNTNDYFILPKERFNTKISGYTTIGIYLINLHLIQPKFSKIFGYINKPFDGSVIGDIEDKLADELYNDRITTDDMSDYYERFLWLASEKMSFLSPSLTPALLKPPPGLRELKEKLFKEHEKELSEDNPNNVVIGSNIENELIKYSENYLKTQDGYENFASKSKINIKNNYKNMNIMKGPLKSSYTGKYRINKSDYNDGIDKSEYSSLADSAVIGSHSRAINTAKGGYLAKKSNQTLNSISAGPKGSDCGTTRYLEVYIYPGLEKTYLNRYILDNGSLKELTSENINDYVNTTVKMRSPMYCRYDEPCYCNICLGNQPYMLGLENFGLAMSRISNKLLNLSLKKFHDLTVKISKIDIDNLFKFDE